MVTLSDEAKGHLDRYLKRVQRALRGHASVDAADVERDVLSHIDAELEGQPQPVAASALAAVLDRLGPPNTWLPADEMPHWKRVLDRLRDGPEDWRLAYLSLACFAIGVVWFPRFPGLPLLKPVLLAASFLLARAALALLDEHDEPVGARRWLLYPPLVAWYAAGVAALLAWPVPLALNLVDRDLRDLGAPMGPLSLSIAAIATGIWWSVLGLALARQHQLVATVLWPFTDGFERRRALWLSLTGVIVAAAGTAVLLALV
jgi:hypothetical protein